MPECRRGTSRTRLFPKAAPQLISSVPKVISKPKVARNLDPF